LLMTNLLAAHAVRFKLSWKRSGIFLLHAGVIVMMLSEFVTGMFALEGIMTITEGKETNYIQHPHSAELAVIDVSDPKVDDTVVIPATVLQSGTVAHEKLPFDIELVDYMSNAVRVEFNPQRVNPATAGIGQEEMMRAVPMVSGADPDQKYDQPAAYVTLKDKATGKAIDTYLVGFSWREQRFKYGATTYEIALRPKRSYRPFTVHLDKAEFKVYPGTTKPKDYSSHVRILDDDGKELRRTRIFMNNPLYFRGETYFQSSMISDEPRRLTTALQVVKDPGKWIPLGMPIISCIMVGVGMLLHFGLNLTEFLRRRILQ